MWVDGMTFMAMLFYSDSGDWGLENKSSADSSIAEVLLRCAQLLLQYLSQWKTYDIVYLIVLIQFYLKFQVYVTVCMCGWEW